MTHLEALAMVLADGGWHTTEELVQEVGHRFSATVHVAVKKHGYQIEKRRMEQNSRAFEYRWVNVNGIASRSITAANANSNAQLCSWMQS